MLSTPQIPKGETCLKIEVKSKTNPQTVHHLPKIGWSNPEWLVNLWSELGLVGLGVSTLFH